MEGGAHGKMLWRRVPLTWWYFFASAWWWWSGADGCYMRGGGDKYVRWYIGGLLGRLRTHGCPHAMVHQSTMTRRRVSWSREPEQDERSKVSWRAQRRCTSFMRGRGACHSHRTCQREHRHRQPQGVLVLSGRLLAMASLLFSEALLAAEILRTYSAELAMGALRFYVADLSSLLKRKVC